jgi:Glyoxalase-like domain
MAAVHAVCGMRGQGLTARQSSGSWPLGTWTNRRRLHSPPGRRWLQQFDLSEDDADDGAWLCDPDGVGPRLFLQQVSEPKVAKKRVHLDVRVAGRGSDDERWARITEAVDRLTTAGATALQHFPGHHVVMADPEGNEFCVC